MATVNEGIASDVVAHDIQLRRVDGDVRNKIDRRLLGLSRDIKALTAKVDPFSPARRDTKTRRLKELRSEAKILINKAYSEINVMARKDLSNIAKAESLGQVQILRENLP